MSRFIALTLLCFLFTTDALHLKRREAKWWPFSSSSEEPKGVSTTSAPAIQRIADTKHAFMNTQVFTEKLLDICKNASDGIKPACQKEAADRLFCAMLQRHQEKFADMYGTQDELDRCKETDIMVDALEAAKDKQEQSDSEHLD